MTQTDDAIRSTLARFKHTFTARPGSARGSCQARAQTGPGYLGDPADLDLMHDIIREARRIVSEEAFEGLKPREISPGLDRTTADALAADIREVSSTSFHPVGSCRMGLDETAVVAPDLRLHGLDGLSIADASVMPLMNTGHPNAPVVMIAEKAADLIAERA